MKKNHYYALLIYIFPWLIFSLVKHRVFKNEQLIILDTILITVIFISIYLLLKNDFKNLNFDKKKSTKFKTLIIIIIGIILNLTGNVLLSTLPPIYFFPTGENMTPILSLLYLPLLIYATVLLQPILEEIIFRKFLINIISKKLNVHLSIVISSIIFVVCHIPSNSTTVILLFCSSLLYSYIYYYTNRLSVPIILHSTFNLWVLLFY